MTGKGPRQVRRWLRQLERGDRHDRAQAAVELGQRGAEQARAALEALLDDPDDLVATAALYGVWRLGGTELPLERAVASLASSDEEIMQGAVHTLCEMADDAVPGLLDLIESDSPHTGAILRILGDIDTERSRAELERIRRSDDPELAAAAAQALED